MSADFVLNEGELPLIVSFPHQGCLIPDDIAQTMTPAGRDSTDTDWHIQEVYSFLNNWPVTTIAATWSRYVVDLNRGADGGLLYPGKIESALCPKMTFDGEPLYIDQSPNESEQERRIHRYWRPYHECLQQQIDRLKAKHSVVVLWDAHSIRGQIASLFEGELPILNFGTNSGLSVGLGATGAEHTLDQVLVSQAGQHSDYSVVANGRFKGGYITRHYGQPKRHQHAIQLEINQSSYLVDQSVVPPQIDSRKQQQLAVLLKKLLCVTLDWAETIKGEGVG